MTHDAFYTDRSGVEWISRSEIARRSDYSVTTIARWIRELKLDTIEFPRKGSARPASGIKVAELQSMLELKGAIPAVKNDAEKNRKDLADAKVREPPKKKVTKAPRKERANMRRHHVVAPYCPFCGKRKVANVTTQSLRLCLACGGVYTVQRFREEVNTNG